MANIVDKYFNKKKKDIFDYTKLINNFLVYDDNQVWTNDSGFNDLAKKTISLYVDKYYFKPMTDFTDYTEYLGALVKCDDRFKTILVCAVNSLPDELKKDNYKVSLYIMAVIIYTSVALNRFTYPYNNYKININNVFSIVDKMFANIDFITCDYDKKSRKALTTLIKRNDAIESKFFDALNTLNTEESCNMYENVDMDSIYYKVKYKYDIPEFKNYRPKDVKKYFNRIDDDLNVLSYELSTLTVLKAKMLNKKLLLLFPIELSFYKKESEITKLLKVLSNEEIRKDIILYIRYEDYDKNKSMVRILINAGFELALDIDETDSVPYRTFGEIKLAMVNGTFLKSNKSNMESWKNNGVELFLKDDINNEVSELKLLGLEDKE